MKRIFIILFLLITGIQVLYPQETLYGPGYRTMLMNNPALAGISDAGILRLSYLNFYPGNHYNLHSFYASYDSYFDVLHGGTAIWLSNDFLGGIINDTRGGFSYAYSLQAGREIFINAGLSAGVFYRGLNFNEAVLPDMIDPFGNVSLVSGETLIPSSRTVFDVGAGLFMIYRNFFAGLSLSHLSQPDLSRGTQFERLKRRINLNAGYSVMINEARNINLKPSGFLEMQGDGVSAGAGSSIESKVVSMNIIIMTGKDKNMDIQTGFSVKTGNLGLFYTYRFNLVSTNNLMPLSLLHHTGLTFSLNTVDKRNEGGTISLPEL